MPEVVFIICNERKIQWVNDYGLEKFGYDSLEKIVGKHIDNFIHPIDRKRMNIRAKAVFSGKIPNREKVKLVKKDGSTFIGLVHSKRICDEDDETIGAFGCVSDITKYIELEHRILKRKELKGLAELAGNFKVL
jgi:PAS domain S-box-containing protein